MSKSLGLATAAILMTLSGGAMAETLLGGAAPVSLSDLETVSGRGVLSSSVDSLDDTATAGPVSIIGQGATVTGSNRIASGAFSGAQGIVTSIQNIGNNVTIQNVTTVTVNIR